MAQVTDDLTKVLEGRDPTRVAITIEAAPGAGPAVRERLTDAGIEYTSVGVRNKTVFDAVVTRPQLTALRSERDIATLDHSPTFSPLGAAPPSDGGNFGLAASVAAKDLSRRTMGEVMDQMNVREAWDELGNRGEGVRIGMVDTPINEQHSALRDAVADTASNTGRGDHGTWVASALVAAPFEVSGGEVYGAAPDADLYAHGALSGGGASVTEIAEGVSYCIESDCDVINISFGGAHSSVLASVIEEAVDAGILVVSSAGNAGPAPGTVTCPAHHTTTTTVGSVSAADDSPASFSSRGPGYGGQAKPDMVAYGGASVNEGGQQIITEVVLGASADGGTQYLVGTSMASPQAAGIAALGVAAEEDEP